MRSLGSVPRTLRVQYPGDFPIEKRAPDGVEVSVLVIQPIVVPVDVAIEREVRAGNLDAARDLKASYTRFVHELWRFGISHLDFSMLNVGIAGSGEAERLQVFDPHMGLIDIAGGGREVHDPMSARPPGVDRRRSSCGRRGTAADGRCRASSKMSRPRPTSRKSARTEPPRSCESSISPPARSIRSMGPSVSGSSNERGGNEEPMTSTPSFMPNACAAQSTRSGVCPLHPRRVPPDAIYDRGLAVRGMHDDEPLAQFRAALKVYQDRPLVLITNVSDDVPRLVKHWGGFLPPEVDVQDDPAIHYHLRTSSRGRCTSAPVRISPAVASSSASHPTAPRPSGGGRRRAGRRGRNGSRRAT